MLFYFAPMQGITSYIYRNAYQHCFNRIDRYFSPFVSANQSDSLRTREINDLLPEHNQGYTLIPQLLTNRAKDFLHTTNRLQQLGYREINLNLGCPSGTVTAKGRGAGFLAQPKELDLFLEEIFAQSQLRISVKTRLGMAQPEEFYALLEIFNKYPITELIIHPRVRQDFYHNSPNYTIFRQALLLSKNPVCYNGDLGSVQAYRQFRQEFPQVEKVMLGRGLIANPGLLAEIQDGKKLERSLLNEFHDLIYTGYRSALGADRNVLLKMKEIWFYMIHLFADSENYAGKIRKAARLSDYDDAVANLFYACELVAEEAKTRN